MVRIVLDATEEIENEQVELMGEFDIQHVSTSGERNRRSARDSILECFCDAQLILPIIVADRNERRSTDLVKSFDRGRYERTSKITVRPMPSGITIDHRFKLPGYSRTLSGLAKERLTKPDLAHSIKTSFTHNGLHRRLESG